MFFLNQIAMDGAWSLASVFIIYVFLMHMCFTMFLFEVFLGKLPDKCFFIKHYK